ncbi:DUF924 family protein [Roseisalinus antarcticus]|uniref:DUF924 domain-containing protein n=1 Tax=Roseisalinus antarcticus TaxID=254357 RepID=A0A1Y5RHH2_9RHOB|nr:DUF924 family protein [Roseisalinus antarcticus]SLN17559.1 hypothetical protein ROA7023_00318 [Roseisalinus antarcticus]
MVKPEDVLSFWADEVGPKGWFEGGEALDRQVRDRFGEAWEAASHGAYGLWLTSPRGSLAYVVLTDQFPRNIFRDDPCAFSTDKSARAASKAAIGRDWDASVPDALRHFFFMPLMHSENLVDQERCIRLLLTRLPGDAGTLLHARCHREIIRRFGRFPFRNAALGRESSAAEQAFMTDGGYGAIVRGFQSASD